MDNFKEIKPEQLDKNPFKLIGSDWMLITAGDRVKANTMTASWGGLGVMWGKNAAFAVIRPQRYTKEFVDKSERFTLSFFDQSYRKQLSYLGSVSGRNEDKIAKSSLTLDYTEEGVPYFKEAGIVLVCRKMFAQEYRPECFIDTAQKDKWYPAKDFHILYISEIEKVFIKEYGGRQTGVV